MPTAQFDQFENLDKPVMPADGMENAQQVWEALSDEREQYLEKRQGRPDPRCNFTEGNTVKYAVRRFKSLELALKEIEPFVRNGAHLQTGKVF